MLNLNSVMIGSHQPKVMAEFYQKVFGRPADMVEGEWYGWKTPAAFFSIGAHSEIKGHSKEPQRVLYNFETSEVQKEFDRLKKEGATVVTKPYKMGDGMIATLADPDGNYFQLMTPWDGA